MLLQGPSFSSPSCLQTLLASIGLFTPPLWGHLLAHTAVFHVESTPALSVSGSLAPRCECAMCLRVYTHSVFIAQPQNVVAPTCGPAHSTGAAWPF